MARERKKRSFIMYDSWLEYLQSLGDAGQVEDQMDLMNAINAMRMGGEYTIRNPAVSAAFEIFIRAEYEKNEKNYQETCDARQQAALEREANKRAQKAQTTTKSTIVLDNHKKQNCDDNENDNEYDNENDMIMNLSTRDNAREGNKSESHDDYLSRVNRAAEIEEVISYLNKVRGSHYRVTHDVAFLIRDRLDEGFTVDDLKKVIDIKYAEWKDTERIKYLRPSTLFGDKFQSYLNQEDGIKQSARSGTTDTAETEEASDEDVARIINARRKVEERMASGQ